MEEKHEKSNKGGRPKQAVLRDRWIGTRFTAAELLIVKQKAHLAGLVLSHFLRESALHAIVTSHFTAEEKEWLRQLTGMANNLNQIAHKGNAEGFLSALAPFQFYRDKLDQLITKLTP